MTRPLPRLVASRFVALFIGLALAAGCSSQAVTTGDPTGSNGRTATSPRTSSTPSPRAPAAPATGACRRLDYAAISRYSNGDPTVSCKSPHTAYTFAVQSLPPGVKIAGVSIGNKSVQDAAAQSCRAAFARFIGGDPAERALSRLSVTYFLPDQRGFNLGATWVRCDVVALKTSNTLASLPDKLKGLLDNPKSLRDFAVCSKGTPGASTSGLVMCTEKHTYRAEAALRLGSTSAAYPGIAAAGKGGQKLCSGYLTKTLGAGSGYTFGWTYPTASDWAAGQRFGYCWLKSPH